MGCGDHVRALAFGIILFIRLCVSLPFRLLRLLAFSTRHWHDRNLRKMTNMKYLLGQDGSLIIDYNVLISLSVQGYVDLEEFIHRFMERCICAEVKGSLEFPEFQERIIHHLGYPFRSRDPDFNIRNHIHGVESNDSREEQKEIENCLINEQFKSKDISPWKILVVSDRVHSTSCVLFLFHHILGDGVSLYHALMRVADSPVPIQPHGIPRSSWFSKAGKVLRLFYPLQIVKEWSNPSTLPFVIQERTTTGERHFAKSSKISKQKLKAIAHRHQVAFTVVLLSAITGALRNYMIRLSLSIPDEIFIYFPTRATGQVKSLELIPSTVYFKLPIGKDCSNERLISCKKTYIEAQNSILPALSNLDIFIQNAYPCPWNHVPLPQIFVSSFPGPSSSVSINGGKVVSDMSFRFNGGKTQGLQISTLTYNGSISIVISASSSVFQSQENADIFMDLLKQQLESL